MARLIDADALKKQWSMADKCEDCPQNARRCQFEQDFTRMDICEMIDEAPTIGGWISVEDRLPYEGKIGEWFVLARVSGTVNGEKCDYAPEVLTFGRSEVAGDIVEEWYDNNFEASFVVHYWMEIPELPEEVSGDA